MREMCRCVRGGGMGGWGSGGGDLTIGCPEYVADSYIPHAIRRAARNASQAKPAEGHNDSSSFVSGSVCLHDHNPQQPLNDAFSPARVRPSFSSSKVFCTPSMASFLRHNQPWAQLVERGNVSIREVEPSDGTDPKSTRLTTSVSFLPVPVPHRAELSDTVAYLITASRTRASTDIERSDLERPTGGTGDALRLFYCPDTDGWSGWKKSIQDWCKEVDVALVDATFYDKHELKGRDMSEVRSVWVGVGTGLPVFSTDARATWVFAEKYIL